MVGSAVDPIIFLRGCTGSSIRANPEILEILKKQIKLAGRLLSGAASFGMRAWILGGPKRIMLDPPKISCQRSVLGQPNTGSRNVC